MKNRRIGQVISEVFDIPLEGISNVPNAQIIGDSILNVDGCIGIKKYESDEIVLRCKDFCLSILGEALYMITFSQGNISVRGKIINYKISRA